jgi:hypothetical protein
LGRFHPADFVIDAEDRRAPCQATGEEFVRSGPTHLARKDDFKVAEVQTDARIIAMIPARIASGREVQTDITKAKSGDSFACP